MADAPSKTIVIGAGIGGLAVALRLAAAGQHVTVLERHGQVGGKMRTVPSAAGPVEAGPTVMTMRPVFEELFAAAGERLSDHVTLHPQSILARHWWSDGSSLDLHADAERSAAAIAEMSGPREAAAFTKMTRKARAMFEAFDAPMMQEPAPNQLALTKTVLANPALLGAMDPLRSMAGSLARQFRDPKLRQLFGRYATYVGGSPFRSPALLSLIWHAEASGVWVVEGGMHKLAEAIAALIRDRGGEIVLGQGVERLEYQDGTLRGVVCDDGTRMACDQVVFNGDPRALRTGLLGQASQNAVQDKACEPRSLSAFVWSFAAKPEGLPLVHHNVFFADTERAEFDALERGEMPTDATLYLCAQDRGDTAQPGGHERFEIIMNGAPAEGDTSQEFDTCQTQTFNRLARMGLHFDARPGPETLTTPSDFSRLFPGSAGSLYGRSPHGLTAGLKRPLARTTIPGLYLVGGGAHPGAGIPMATLSAKHAAAAILKDRTSTSPSRRTATRGGMSTA
ncbi:1-hydroxycarotenoid 3,4-desaturase [Litoreibacter ponti]|uniref:1-hydroxycarotenoid 3,4-desaturase n=1 Tax=Litoreibacter ponti TaxID=1510457 RepID=A0A2T6BPE7_9RHOB|nr:1-hydroxycarotenoid 3,4-desaturase CrtD [Litoreibacter ponti]PTX57953.1 1-hydroxycarotenoid 3,4-desaturase [Litoreibacter ponti]